MEVVEDVPCLDEQRFNRFRNHGRIVRRTPQAGEGLALWADLRI